MIELFEVCNNYMLPHVVKPLARTHSKYFLTVLNEYDIELQNYLYYGAISYNSMVLMAGTEYEFDKIVDIDGYAPNVLFDKIINPNGKRYLELVDIYKLANAKELSTVFIPVLVNENMLFFVCAKHKMELMRYLGIQSFEELYNDYPLLCSILKWGITYMVSDDSEDRLNDIIYTGIKQSENYIKVYNEIVENVMREKWLPYASTLHTISNWNYEQQANYGYIDFIEPLYTSGELQVKFTKPIVFSASRARALRKYIELSNDKLRIKAESSKGYILSDSMPEDSYWTFVGLGKQQMDNVVTVRFEGKSSWRLFLKKEFIFYNGSIYLFKRKKEETPEYYYLTSTFYHEKESITQKYEEETVKRVNQIIKLASAQSHGTMVVFSPDAQKEVKRLCKCGRGIEIDPIDFNKLLSENYDNAEKTMYNLTKIDGAIFFDEAGICYSIGTIVDGRACENSDPGRGARYNSALTYVNDCDERNIQCYCAVISEDGTVDAFGKFGNRLGN